LIERIDSSTLFLCFGKGTDPPLASSAPLHLRSVGLDLGKMARPLLRAWLVALLAVVSYGPVAAQFLQDYQPAFRLVGGQSRLGYQ
jgi:hypothetical protein